VKKSLKFKFFKFFEFFSTVGSFFVWHRFLYQFFVLFAVLTGDPVGRVHARVQTPRAERKCFPAKPLCPQRSPMVVSYLLGSGLHHDGKWRKDGNEKKREGRRGEKGEVRDLGTKRTTSEGAKGWEEEE
jgi:hypothetical protein